MTHTARDALLAALIATAASAASAAGDPRAGAELYADLCSGCHAAEQHGVGPAHRGVFGRKAATGAGYAYSAALKKSGLTWN